MEQLPPIQPWMTRAEKMKIHRRKYAISLKGRVQSSLSQQRFMNTEKGRAKTKRHNAIVRKERPNKSRAGSFHARALRAYIKGSSYGPYVAVAKAIKSTWEPWMNWSNYGQYVVDAPRRWCIGHHIPVDVYSDDPEDVKRCFDVENLHAQDAIENADQGPEVPPPYVLEILDHLIPMAWE